MRPLKGWIFLIFMGFAFQAQAQAPDAAEQVVAALDSNHMRTHLAVLAHDSLEGRGPDTPGGRKAAEYIAARFKELGLTPRGDSGSYFHHFRYTTVHNISSSVRSGGDTLLYGIEQLVTTPGASEGVMARGEAVFVGYGLSTPAWDDYKGKNIEGKIAIVLAGLPRGADASALPPNAATRGYKARTASEHGARVTLMIHREDLASFTWRDIQQFWTDGQVTSTEPGSTVLLNAPAASGFLSAAAGNRLLQAGGYTLDQAVEMANSGASGPIALPVVLDVAVANDVRVVNGRNVVAGLRGSGPNADDAVIIGGHYDHLGIGPEVDGDSIYNGAEDNAGGTAQLLALAEAFARSGVRPRRSLLFVGFDAEEAGLIGAEAFVARPPVPLPSQVAMINLDAANLWGATRDAAALGLKESTLDGSFRRAAEAEGMVVPATQPDSIEAFFLRSDQLPFARAGVPAIFVFVGWDFVGRTPAWASRMWSDYFEQRYHRPADNLLPGHSMSGALQQARVVARMALDIANAAERAQWVRGSRFRRE